MNYNIAFARELGEAARLYFDMKLFSMLRLHWSDDEMAVFRAEEFDE